MSARISWFKIGRGFAACGWEALFPVDFWEQHDPDTSSARPAKRQFFRGFDSFKKQKPAKGTK